MIPGMLQGQVATDGGVHIPTLGFVIWWNVKGVEVGQEWFKNKLNEVGLDGERYAKNHNYRNTFLRCLKQLEEKRIIRKVTEDHVRMVIQFTAETLIDDDPDSPRLEYTPETVIEIDKEAYSIDGIFEEALVKCDPRIKEILIQLFEQERKTFRSSDITRYVKKIFQDHADIVSLREQGSVYFVPASYQNLVTQVATVLEAINRGSAQLEFFPVPDVQSARNMVSHGVEAEVVDVFSKMEEEIEKMQSGGNEITDNWVEHRQNKIKRIQKRLAAYVDVLGDTAQQLSGKFDILAAVLRPRALEI